MSVTTNRKQEAQNHSKTTRGSVAKARRGQGMRVGTLDDWRAGSAKASSQSSDRGKRLRDGR